MIVFTIGFAKKSAEQFFTLLKQPGLSQVVDIRLKNVSQLAGFTKKDDLRFFLKSICSIDYIHLPDLAPTKKILDDYRRNGGSWDIYERSFIDLMTQRQVENKVPRHLIDGSCLLCSEPSPEHCHRRLVAEYLHDRWGDLEIRHL